LVAFFPVVPACQPHTELTDEQKYRLELVEEIKAFEKRLGFSETENFRIYSDEVEAYDYYFHTPSTELPYSLDDPMLKFGEGTRENAPIDLKKNDVFFYSIQALAGIKTPVTKSLIESPLSRFIHVVFHEDWHEQIDLPLGIEEPSAEVVGYNAAMLFAEEKFGQDSEVYDTLNEELSKKHRESEIYRDYYEQLDAVYSSFHAGAITEKETLSEKEQLLKSMGDELKDLWGGKPDQLSNAFIAFQMTYQRHFPLMYQVFSKTDFDLVETVEILRAMPEQGNSYSNLEEIKSIEEQVIQYLEGSLQRKALPAVDAFASLLFR